MKLFLLGLMGTGKSYWARKLAKRLRVGGYDLDYLVESHEERSIAEIFAEDGEAHFRKVEAKVLRWFGEKKSFVLATGGGTPCQLDNMQWMNAHGVTIWIDEPVETLVERLREGKAHRPLIKDLENDALNDFLVKKRAERISFYQQANHHVQGEAISDAGFARIIRTYA